MNSSTVAINIAILSLVFSTLTLFNTREEPEAKQVPTIYEGSPKWWPMKVSIGTVMREYDAKLRMDNQEEVNTILSTCRKDADGIRSAICSGGLSGQKLTCSCMETL